MLGKELVPPRDGWNPIDDAIYRPEDPYRVKVEEANSLRLRAIRFSFNRFYDHNRFYHTLCKQRGITPEDVKTLDDLAKVPLVPGDIFKGYPEPEKFVAWLRGISCDDVRYPKTEGSSYEEIIDRLREHGVRVMFSTGTSGRCTFCPRDQVTFSRVIYHQWNVYRMIHDSGIHRPVQDPGIGSDTDVYFVGMVPDVRDSTWSIAYAFNLYRDLLGEGRTFFSMDAKSSLATTKYILGGRKSEGDQTVFDERVREEAETRLIRQLEDLDKRGAKCHIGGATFQLVDLLSKMDRLGIRLNMRTSVIEAGGGWKRAGQEVMTPGDLYEKIERVLGIPHWNYRDVYGLTEFTGCFPSCEGHYYHMPSSVVQPFVLDEQLEPKGFGEWGQFAFLDALSNVYPGYVIVKDKVKLLESCPSCDRPGPVISPPIERMPGAEDRGCMYSVRKLMIEEMTKA